MDVGPFHAQLRKTSLRPCVRAGPRDTVREQEVFLASGCRDNDVK